MNFSTKLHETAKYDGSKIAYYFKDESSTYAELNQAITQFASGLEQLGVKKGDHIALLLDNSPQFVISLHGAFRLGATVIPINPIYTADEIGYILDNGDVKAVVALKSLIPILAKKQTFLPKVGHYVYVDTEEKTEDLQGLSIYPKLKSFTSLLAFGNLDFQEPEMDEDDVAVILYTSGTTGKPKGAMLTHKNLYSNAMDVSHDLKITSDDIIITVLPMFHVFCLTDCLNSAIICRAAMLIVPRFSPREIFRLGKKYQPTIFFGVPTMFNFLNQFSEGNPEDLASLRLCFSGGASLPVSLLRNFEKKFNVVILEGYGLSEASPTTTFNPLDRERKPGSIGTSISHVENKVVNEFGEEVPVGEVGELIVRGPNVMKGYYKMPEETNRVLKDGWLYTGDLARMDGDGYFYIVDRKKDLIIVGGYNVYPREVEEVFYHHPDIVEAAVFGVPDSDRGEAVVAYVVTKDPYITAEQLHDYCKEHLAKYKLPSAIEIIGELPKSGTGKILRRALKEQLVEKVAL
ncbi:fatty acid--CoA ligase family protein [Neobacillus sp. SAB-20_R2A]|uniref:fatty acid--CoA ligase family protein n=1 Tax=Neobacillus sp. SAB-20_R2A TaxID=3120519 RepID=UPI003C6DDAAF